MDRSNSWFIEFEANKLNWIGPLNSNRVQQLMDARLFPASVKVPRTLMTFQVLKHYTKHNLASKKSSYDFIRALRALSDGFFHSRGLGTCSNSDQTNTTEFADRILILSFFWPLESGENCDSTNRAGKLTIYRLHSLIERQARSCNSVWHALKTGSTWSKVGKRRHRSSSRFIE